MTDVPTDFSLAYENQLRPYHDEDTGLIFALALSIRDLHD